MAGLIGLTASCEHHIDDELVGNPDRFLLLEPSRIDFCGRSVRQHEQGSLQTFSGATVREDEKVYVDGGALKPVRKKRVSADQQVLVLSLLSARMRVFRSSSVAARLYCDISAAWPQDEPFRRRDSFPCAHQLPAGFESDTHPWG